MTKIEMQAMDAVIGIHREMKKANEVDWEQRRYEIAKEVFLSLKNSLNPYKEDAKNAVEIADLLIAELKKEKKRWQSEHTVPKTWRVSVIRYFRLRANGRMCSESRKLATHGSYPDPVPVARVPS